MWAAMIHDANPTRAVAKCDQLLAEQHQAKGCAAATLHLSRLEIRRFGQVPRYAECVAASGLQTQG
jgi:hypothetical protein